MFFGGHPIKLRRSTKNAIPQEGRARGDLLVLDFSISPEQMAALHQLDRQPAVQTFRFNTSLTKIFSNLHSFKITRISSQPVSDYPAFPRRWVNGGKVEIPVPGSHSQQCRQLSFVNTSTLKPLTRFFGGAFHGCRDFWAAENKAAIVVYSVHLPYLILGWTFRRVFRVPYIGIWTDPPAVPLPTDRGIKAKLRNAEELISRFFMERVDAAIVLTQALADDYAPRSPHIVIEGFVDLDEEREVSAFNRKHFEQSPSNITRVVYTGSVASRYGLPQIVEAFQQMQDPSIHLHVYGRGDYEDSLKGIAEASQNIHYHGQVTHFEARAAQRNADFLINARPPSATYTRYSFPSKLLEYMSSGTPVIATMLPGMSESYRQHLILLANDDPQTISRTLIQASCMTYECRRRIAEGALRFAHERAIDKQGKRIEQFLRKVTDYHCQREEPRDHVPPSC